MILPKTDHDCYCCSFASSEPKIGFVTSHDVTIAPFGDAVEVAQSARATRATISRIRKLGLLSLTPTITDASKSAPFPHCHRIDAAFSFLSSMRSCKLGSTKKEMCR
jgi:hypothetical protein